MQFPGPIIRFAQVVRVEPKFRTCELVFVDDGWRQANVPILSMHVSSNSGAWTMHNMVRPPSEELAGGLHPDLAERTVLAVCVMIENRPIILGFTPHPLSQLMFTEDEQNRDLWRHPSGTLATVNKRGDLEIQHTGGAFVRIAFDNDDGPADQHQDLTPLCANENWELPENEPATITICTGNKDGEALKLRIRPNGDTDAMSAGYLHVAYQKDLHIDIGDQAQVHIVKASTHSAGDQIKIRTPADVTVSAGGTATVQAVGDAHVYAGTAAVVAAGADATVAAVGNAQVIAAGGVEVGAAGPIVLASGMSITLDAPEITANTPLFLVTGEIEEEGGDASSAGILGAALGTAAAALGAAAAAAAQPEVDAAVADIEEAEETIVLAVEEAVATSEPARGTGKPDNEGFPIYEGESGGGGEEPSAE